jgi:hypothetical protein
MATEAKKNYAFRGSWALLVFAINLLVAGYYHGVIK